MSKLTKIIRNTAGMGLVAAALSNLSGCGSCSNSINDISRDINKTDYEIKLFDSNGKVIYADTVRNTYIQVSEHGSGIRYLKDGKTVMLNGTYILRQLK